VTTPRAILAGIPKTGIPNKPSRPLVLPLLPNPVIPSEARDPYPLPSASGFPKGFRNGPVPNGTVFSNPFRLPLLCLLLAAVLLPAPGRNGQLAADSKPSKKEYALIFGTIWGPDDRPVYGIPVKIRRAQDKKPKWEVYSDHRGEFAQRVPPGEADYILTADLKGVKTADGKPLHQVSEVKVHIDYDEREDTGLHLAP
jgi:hypothetical protein